VPEHGRGNRHGLQADRGGAVTLRAVNAPHPIALVRPGARFEHVKLVERPDDKTGADAA